MGRSLGSGTGMGPSGPMCSVGSAAPCQLTHPQAVTWGSGRPAGWVPLSSAPSPCRVRWWLPLGPPAPSSRAIPPEWWQHSILSEGRSAWTGVT